MEGRSSTCPQCSRSVPVRFPRCGYCRAVIAVDEARREIRRTATIVTSDLKGSTALGERLDPESLREVMTTYIDEMRAVFEAHGGTIEKIIGDAIVAVFGLPTAREDDALRAVEAAAETQRALVSLNDRLDERWGVRLTVRTGVASGEVVVGEASIGQHVLTGPTIGIATAMEQNAASDEVLLGASTYELVGDSVEVEPMGVVTPKGTQHAEGTYRLVSVAERAVATAASAPDATSRLCQTCGEENPDDFTSCGSCGDELARRTRVMDTRKTVTIVFADPKPASRDGSAMSAEAVRDVMSRYFAAMQTALERHGATVEKFIGDAVMAVFGLPIRHEDDALRAIRAAREMQDALPALNAAFDAEYGVTLGNHIGVNTGEVVAGDASLGQRLVTGDTVNVAARLEQAAGAGEILLGDLTYRLVRGAATVDEVEPLTLKGKSQPVPAYRLLGLAAAREGIERRHDAPMVGRDGEMRDLERLFERALAERGARMATVVGDAGVGKTRLIAEFTAGRRADALVIRGRCLPYGEGITFWPLREAARDASGISDDEPQAAALAKLRATARDEAVTERIASVIGLSTAPFPVPEIFWGARKFLEGLARERPVLVVWDDIHWAEATFLELVNHLVETIEAAPILILCSSRHDLLETHPEWALGERDLRVVLQPLTEADAGLVVQALLGGTGIAPRAQERIVRASAGNPLFVEQLLSMLIDDGSLRREGDRWDQVRDLARLSVPPSIQALLAARLDLLDRSERSVIEPASVIGQNFAQAAVTVLAPDAVRSGVAGHLESLDRKQLVQANPGSDDDDAVFRFRHLLVRDAAYGGLLKRARAELHERFVDWAEELNERQGRAQEFEEIQGYHLEQAYRYLTELGTVDDHARQVGIRASTKLASAGRRAMARGDMPAAANMLRRAAATRDPHDAVRLRLLPDLGEALEELGEFEEAQRVLAEAIDGGVAISDLAIAAEAEMVLLSVRLYLGEDDGWGEAVDAAVRRVTPIFAAAGEDIGLARAQRLMVAVHGSASRFGLMSEAALEVIRHARAGGDLRVERRGAIGYAQAALYGPTPVTDGIREIEELADNADGDRRTQALLRTWLAQLYAMDGDLERARATYETASATLRDLGGGLASASTSTELAQIELEGGDLSVAEAALRADYASLSAIGEKYILAGVVGLLGKVLELQQRHDELEPLSLELAELAGADDVTAQVDWRGLSACVRSRRGDAAAAIMLAREAVDLASTTDFLVVQADAERRLAAVLINAGQERDAALARDRARDLYRRKGDTVAFERLEV